MDCSLQRLLSWDYIKNTDWILDLKESRLTGILF